MPGIKLPKKALISTAFIFMLFSVYAQSYQVKGYVFDSITGNPLSFVNIIINNTSQGGSSDIDGRFHITSSEKPQFLRLSYVGYNTQIKHIKSFSDIEIYMSPAEITLDEVTILPGKNPAHRIIGKAIENRHKNDPEKRTSFEYKSHNKLSFAVDTESFLKKERQDTALSKEEIEILEKNYLFLVESITHRRFKYPSYNSEVVLASRISGLEEPLFSMLASQLQTFSFYDDYISLLDKRFLNPISPGSKSRYLFILEDTTYLHADTVYIISYRPRINRNFDGLKGLLYINTNGYALQNVIAAPADDNISGFGVNIRQAYTLIDSLYWFPTQLNTELIYVYPDEINLTIIGNGRSYLTEITIGKDMNRRDFSHIAFEVNPGALDENIEIWERYRFEPLTEKDMATYQLLDSLSKEYNFSRLTNLMKTLLEGKIPAGIFNIDIGRLATFNNYSGWRLGLGLETNHKLSSAFSVGGYTVYSTRINKLRYGAHAQIYIDRRNDVKLKYNYINDDIESAPLNSFQLVPRLELQNYRSYIISITDQTKAHRASFSFRPQRYLLTSMAYTYSEITPNFNYKFVNTFEDVNYLQQHFSFSELSLNFRFAFRESFMLIENNKMSLGTRYPIVKIGATQGFKGFLHGQFDYTRFDIEIENTHFIRHLGRFRYLVTGGYIMGAVPYSKMYNGCGSYEKFSVYSPFTFSTMRLNEFLADKYIAVLTQHSFGNLLFTYKQFRPEIMLVNNFCIGALSNPELHRYFEFESVEKGYFETGVVINNIIRSGFYGMGIASFYRYGPYAFDSTIDNIVLQMSLNISL